MALDVAHTKSLLTVQVFLENREYHLKIAPGDHLKIWKTWINLLEILKTWKTWINLLEII